MPSRAGADDRLSVFVGILPQKSFVQQIGGDRVGGVCKNGMC
jgi:hypothetical protein